MFFAEKNRDSRTIMKKFNSPGRKTALRAYSERGGAKTVPEIAKICNNIHSVCK